jgi:hypothetical protein
MCGRIWTCPVCSQNKRAARAEKIAAALRGLGGRWQMLTVTLRHREGMPLKDLQRALMKAWRRCRQGGAKYSKRVTLKTNGGRQTVTVRNPRRGVQSIWNELVTASARAAEIPHGKNGWHPHLHVLLRTSSWDEEDRAILLTRWKEAIRRELGDACTPNDEHALHWSDPIDAADPKGRERYLTKLGLEVAGPATKDVKGQNHWQLAERAHDGDQRALRLWEEYCRATKGRRMIELDDRAADAARRQIEAERILPAAQEGPWAGAIEREQADKPREPIEIQVHRDAIRALRHLESRSMPGIFATLLTLAETEGRAAVEQWIAYAWDRAARDSPAERHPPDAPEGAGRALLL